MSSPTEQRRVLLINPNTNATTTEMMRDYAAAQLPGHEVIGISAAAGPSMIVDPQALWESVDHVIEAVEDYLSAQQVAGVIVSAIGDPGRAELAERLSVPVVGIGEASILAAAKDGGRFGMATSTPQLVDSLTDLVRSHGKADQFLGVELTVSPPLELAADPDRQHQELEAAVRASVAKGASAVIIAGGPLSETARRLAAANIATIIEPIPSACALLTERLDAGALESAE